MDQMQKDFSTIIKRILSERTRKVIEEPDLTPSAIMLLLYEKESKLNTLLTRRTQDVAYHKGEISFPGGVYDLEDGRLVITALRETFEEIGLRPKDVFVLGPLDDHQTLSNFRITPFVGTFCYPYPFVINKAEIDHLIEIPLEAFLKEQTFWKEMRIHQGKPFPVYFYKINESLIWGATARIIRSFLDILTTKSDIFNSKFEIV